MGKDLIPRGNSIIPFSGRKREDLIREINLKLDAIKFVNETFLRENSLEDDALNEWKVSKRIDYLDFDKRGRIEFDGPFGLSLGFMHNTIDFEYVGCIRYIDWFKKDNEIERNEWRKYIFDILKSFGGNRVIYLADNSDPLEKYTWPDFDGCFEEIEPLLKEDPDPWERITSFEDLSEDKLYDDWFFVDYFEDLKPKK